MLNYVAEPAAFVKGTVAGLLVVHFIIQETLPVLHSDRDDIGPADFAGYYDSCRLLAAYLAWLDAATD